MRTDAKIGLVLSVVLVVIAGWYFSRPKPTTTTIALDDTPSMAHRLARQRPVSNPRTLISDVRRDTPVPVGHHVSTRAPSPRIGHSHGESTAGSATGTRTAARKTYPQPIATGANPSGLTARGKSADILADVTGNRRSKQHDHARGAGQPTAASAGEHHRAGAHDTLAKLAEIYYGDKRLAHVLAAANPDLPVQRTIPTGTLVSIPDYADNPHDFSNRRPGRVRRRAAARTANGTQNGKPGPASSRRTYIVQEGDSFYSIAASRLGSGNRWPKLYELNKKLVGNNPNHLRPGQVLQLPAE